jgi:histidyl-tRNA synthetase
MEFILESYQSLNKKSIVDADITLARGLNYYTGAIIEVKIDDSRSAFTSSVCGGGRYDDLTGIFGLPNVSGVGISFGADRICDVLEEIKGFPDFSGVSTKILFANFGEKEALHCLKLAAELRAANINTEVYPDPAKIKKQMSYADTRKIPFVALIGSDEMIKNIITVKNMTSGEQFTTDVSGLIVKINQ